MATKRRLLYSAFFIIVIVLSGLFFRIKSVECSSDKKECSREISESLMQISGKNGILSAVIINNILKNNPLIKDYSVRVSLAGVVDIQVTEKTPRNCLSVGGMSYFIDEDGVIIKKGEDSSGCITKTNGSDYKVKDFVSSSDNFCLSLDYKLRNLKTHRNSRIENGIFVIDYEDGIKLIFPLEGNAELIAGRVYYTLSQFDRINKELSGKRITEADFRFKEPIIRYL